MLSGHWEERRPTRKDTRFSHQHELPNSKPCTWQPEAAKLVHAGLGNVLCIQQGNRSHLGYSLIINQNTKETKRASHPRLYRLDLKNKTASLQRLNLTQVLSARRASCLKLCAWVYGLFLDGGCSHWWWCPLICVSDLIYSLHSTDLYTICLISALLLRGGRDR